MRGQTSGQLVFATQRITRIRTHMFTTKDPWTHEKDDAA